MASSVEFKLRDRKGSSPENIPLHTRVYPGQDHHDDNFTVHIPRNEQLAKVSISVELSAIEEMEIWRANDGIDDEIFIDTVTIRDIDKSEHKHVIPVHKWVDQSYRGYFHYSKHTYLPQNDPKLGLRKKDLLDAQKKYQLEQKTHPGLPEFTQDFPPAIKSVPLEENFSFCELLTLGAQFVYNKFAELGDLLKTGDEDGYWKSVGEMQEFLESSDVFKKPVSCDRWREDSWFAWQRMNGLNYSLIEIVRSVPVQLINVKSDVEAKIGMTIEDAIANKRLFVVDLSIIGEMRRKREEEPFAPIAFFYLDENKILLPCAIQLHQGKRSAKNVFLPTDKDETWTIAKMWFNLADAQYHQAITHLGFTHLLMEGISVCVHRHLSTRHPMFKLVAPHLLYIIAINAGAYLELIAPNTIIDKIMYMRRYGCFKLISLMVNKWELKVDGTLPEDLKRRGVNDENILPQYYYRDDGLALYNIIKTYVSEYVDMYYGPSQNELKDDYELHGFREQITRQRGDNGGCGILGVPEFDTTEGVKVTFTSIIYISSVAHAAANFQQYQEYAFTPNYPGLLRGNPPKKTDKILTKSDLNMYMPKRVESFNTMAITKLLSTHNTKPLGDFEHGYIQDKDALEVVQRFKTNLRRLSRKIATRNKENAEKNLPTYVWLDPANIPNSIAI